MNSFSAQIIYRIECDGIPTDQYEEQWRLVYGSTIQEALDEALDAGKNEETTIIDRHGRAINWRMLAVKDIQPIEIKHRGLLVSMIRDAELIPAPLWAV
jgi:Domain of unknown function (DUF4288)